MYIYLYIIIHVYCSCPAVRDIQKKSRDFFISYFFSVFFQTFGFYFWLLWVAVGLFFFFIIPCNIIKFQTFFLCRFIWVYASCVSVPDMTDDGGKGVTFQVEIQFLWYPLRGQEQYVRCIGSTHLWQNYSVWVQALPVGKKDSPGFDYFTKYINFKSLGSGTRFKKNTELKKALYRVPHCPHHSFQPLHTHSTCLKTIKCQKKNLE